MKSNQADNAISFNNDNKILTLLQEDTNFRALQDFINAGKGKNIVAESAAVPYINLGKETDNFSVMVVKNDIEAEKITSIVSEFLGNKAVFLPAWETLPHERISPSLITMGKRMQVLGRLQTENSDGIKVLICSVKAFVQSLVPEEIQQLVLAIGKENDFAEVVTTLTGMGFNRVDMVTQRGEYAVRGGIIDIFPSVFEMPVRVEFWGDEVTDIKEFSVSNQLTVKEKSLAELIIYPTREILITDKIKKHARELQADYAKYPVIREMLEQLIQGIYAGGMEALAPLLYAGNMQKLADLFPSKSKIFLVEPELLKTQLHDLDKANQDFLLSSWDFANDENNAPLDLSEIIPVETYDFDRIYREFESLEHVAFEISALNNSNFSGDTFTFNFTSPQKLLPQLPKQEDVINLVRERVKGKKLSLLTVKSDSSAATWLQIFNKSDIPTKVIVDGKFTGNTLNLVVTDILEGIYVPDSDFLLITENLITGKRTNSVRKQKKNLGKGKVDPIALQKGDYVVHEQYGIGVFQQLVKRNVNGIEREYIVLEFAPNKKGHPGDRLFVPTDTIDQLSKYIGGEKPALSKLGGQEWQTAKNKARKAVKEIAEELVKLYAARTAVPGFAFSPDSPWQTELEDNFEHVETIDQLEAINAVKADMEKSIPMDRVVVGDVGYGKTEIAVRAAFKAVQGNKQVAILVPTTLLAQQHFQTFSQRMIGFPVKIAVLSRFSTPKEVKELEKNIAAGEVDIVIGTHRLLQGNIRWKDLGLVIIDEEQRFGVEHKEFIKSLRTQVDVLTMSATPIPRTLEMSLVGIREMSTILTPPEERLPVLTYVGKYDEKQVAAVIKRELLRGGQVFYVHNKVSSIDATAKRLKELVPEAKFAVAHGKLSEDNLEKTVSGFWNKEYDVLVCTTIVETGLDIANANTLIVEDATHLGLSQLHQLRGRVGRSGERGYAYFFYPPQSELTPTAHERLVTIAQNNELGTGMAVAMKDLELRGAGNVLGAEQSGHIAGVGFDLYVRMVGEAVTSFKSLQENGVLPKSKTKDIRLDLGVDASIPEDYIASDRLRLEAYRKIADSSSKAELGQVLDEFSDRYGKLPVGMLRAASLHLLRNIAADFGIKEMVQIKDKIKINNIFLQDSQQVRLGRLYPGSLYRPGFNSLTLPVPKNDAHELIENEILLEFLAKFFENIFADENVDYDLRISL